ncbi:MAG TPA: DinB family protein [Acidobacteriaceae bacterium]
MSEMNAVEPWLRGTLPDVDAIARAVLHALELAEEDATKWCGGLSDAEMNARPHGIAPVAFHLRHIARSLDRLLSYAEGSQLEATQKAALKSELDESATTEAVMAELEAGLRSGAQRVRAFSPDDFNTPRGVGRAMLPTTVGGLLVHCADHTQRHIGQAVTTAKVVIAMRS